MANYAVIYDGLCNLCVNFVKGLEQIDRGQLFCFVPMQDADTLSQWQISATDCEMGMILIDLQSPEKRWQGSIAAEEIANLLPLGNIGVGLYRIFPGLKSLGDRSYAQVRDHRYQLFGLRDQIYNSSYGLVYDGVVCDTNCKQFPSNG